MEQEKETISNTGIVLFYIIVFFLFIAGAGMAFRQAYVRGEYEYAKEYWQLNTDHPFLQEQIEEQIRQELNLPRDKQTTATRAELKRKLELKRASHAAELQEKRKKLAEKHKYLYLWSYPEPGK